MNKVLLKTIALGVTLSATAAQASLSFSSLSGSSVEFAGGGVSQFTITGSLEDQWKITTPGSSAEGLLGSFDAVGPWSYGPITPLGGGVEAASVTGPTGTFSINDGMGKSATGNVTWVQVATFSSSFGALNAAATVNITGMTYSGHNHDLLALVNGDNGSVNLSFQFNDAESLTDLTTGTGPWDSMSYSGTFSPAPVPEPATLLTGALLLLPLAAGTLRVFRKKRTV